VQQVLLYHLLKGQSTGMTERLQRLSVFLSPVLAPGLLGLYFLYREAPELGLASSLWTLGYLVFYLLLSPTLCRTTPSTCCRPSASAPRRRSSSCTVR